MILTPEVLAIFILNGIFLIFSTIALVLSVKIFKNWDMDKTTQEQYKLEKNSFLTATIIKYIFIVKLPLFLFFIFTLDKISNTLIGAMCAAGVVDATQYGIYLFVFKIINLYIFGFWLVLNKADISKENLPYTRLKFGLFIIFYILLLCEIVIETLMFSSIDPSIMVSCCGTLYSSTSSSYISEIFKISNSVLLSAFYGTFFLLVLGYYLKNRFLYGVLSVIFLVISIISLIAFFGTYIYELPTHHCPFCFLQKDYYYIGYLLYVTLFGGTFFGVLLAFFDKKKLFFYSMVFTGIYTFIVTFYPVRYYLVNGVWL
jgi:hypothetical protein